MKLLRYISGGKECGPVSADAIWQMVDRGDIPRNTLVSGNESGTWREFSTLKDDDFSAEIIAIARTRKGAGVSAVIHKETSGPMSFRTHPLYRGVLSVIGWLSLSAAMVWLYQEIPKAPTSSADDSPLRVEAHSAPTKVEWKERASQIPDVGQILNRYGGLGLNVRKYALFKVVGPPTSTQEVGTDIYLYWDCTDGQIQIVADRAFFESGSIVGSVNSY